MSNENLYCPISAGSAYFPTAEFSDALLGMLLLVYFTLLIFRDII